MSPEWLPKKKRFRLLVAVDPKSIRLNDRIAYSYLAYRARYGRGATASEVADQTGLARKDGVTVALKRLQARSLVERAGGEWIALEPTEPHFQTLEIEAGHWSQRLAYVWYSPPRHTLTTAQAYLLWTALGMPNSSFNVTGLTRMLGLSKHTTLDALAVLEGGGMLRREGAGGYRFRLVAGDIDHEMFADRDIPEQDQYETWLRQDGVPAYLRANLLHDLKKLPNHPSVFIRALEGHQGYRDNHPDSPTHCGFRLRMEIDKEIRT